MTAAAPMERVARTITMDQVGGGRAVTFALPLLERAYARSGLTKPILTIFDPAPGKALIRAREAAAHGIEARPVEQKGQDAIAAAGPSDTLLHINVDHAPTAAECLVLAAENERPVCVNVFVQLPTGKLLAIRAAFAAKDAAGKIALAAFFFTLGRITVRAGSSKIWGADAPAANGILEGPMREWFVAALDRAHAMAAGVAVDGAPIEITYNGVETIPLFIRDSRTGWADRATLAREVADQTTTPITRGTAFAIAEVGVDAIQLVHGKFRALDRTMAVDAPESIDVRGYEEAEHRMEAVEEERRAEVEAALRRAEQSRLTATNPVYVTD